MATASTRPAPGFQPDLVLLLVGDPNDAVARAVIGGASQLGWPVVALALEQLVDELEFGGEAWTVGGRRIDPQRTALVNRLPMSDRLEVAQAAPDIVAKQAVWRRLREELGRFRYASSLPTASSIMGCYASLHDQWTDLPRLVPGLRVPEHSTPSSPRGLAGNVFTVNRWSLYSLGKPRADAAAGEFPDHLRLDYVRPPGRLVHLAQVGGSMFFPNPPPEMTRTQADAMVAFARSLAAVSRIRILEHAFFLGDGMPVLYSTCPVPVVSGMHPTYPELVRQGLRDDIEKCGGRPRP
jgi:hypothetical protein